MVILIFGLIYPEQYQFSVLIDQVADDRLVPGAESPKTSKKKDPHAETAAAPAKKPSAAAITPRNGSVIDKAQKVCVSLFRSHR
jgi:hypothetical protein